VARKKTKGLELSVFKGREAKLNRAILQSVALKGPQTIYNIYKLVKMTKSLRNVHYGNVNKRVRALAKLGYTKAIKTQDTKAGFEANVFELTAKAQLSLLLSSTNMEDLLNLIEENYAMEIVAAILASINRKIVPTGDS
jgi:hypothetical protein